MACLKKHVSKAFVYATETTESEDRRTEAALCRANLSCAGEHAMALGFLNIAADCRKASEGTITEEAVRAVFDALFGPTESENTSGLAVGELGVAEDRLRMCGRGDLSERVREIRKEIQS